MGYLEGLNDLQKEAVQHTNGPLLIIAGAGAGKTKTITHRMAHLVESGIAARSILAVTFTNKAAGEMRERARALMPTDGGAPLVSTFHSLGVRLLREFHAEAALPRGFTIWDRDDSTRAIKRILEQLQIADQTPRSVLSHISRKKGEGLAAAEFATDASTYRERAVARAWVEYERALTEEGALDFDDLLGKTLRLIANNDAVRARLQSRWSHLTIDEYQDTNRSQIEIARLIAGDRRNLCVVGDIDQSIYSWRGADIEHLLSFEKAFPGAKVVTLEQNYRSTRTILAAAGSVIEKNTRRRPKHLFTENETGESIDLFGAANEIEEAWFVAGQAAECISAGTKPGEIAVLYRENFQSRALEEAFLHLGVPYRVLGVRFFERKEVKDVLSWLRAAMNQKSSVDLARAVIAPPRGIGKVTLEKMLRADDASLTGAARAKVAQFRDTLQRIHHAIHTLPASDAVRYAVEASGMEKMYGNDDEGRERLANIQELVSFATRYDDSAAGNLPPQGIELLLEEAALQSDQDQLRDDANMVSLMTVHASKGLEFDVVFITGLEQGLFPSQRIGDDQRDDEEERRLFYVALTRARRRAFLTYASERMKYGSREYTIPSEFLDDIDARLIRTRERKRSLLDDDERIIR